MKIRVKRIVAFIMGIVIVIGEMPVIDVKAEENEFYYSVNKDGETVTITGYT